MFKTLEYIDPDHTMIRATQPDGHIVLIDAANPAMWNKVASGVFGAVSAFSPPTKEEITSIARAGMTCSRLQARLALGPDTCAVLDAMADDPTTPWAMRQTLAYAQQWQRTHTSMDEIGWALGYDAEQIDALFQLAAKL